MKNFAFWASIYACISLSGIPSIAREQESHRSQYIIGAGDSFYIEVGQIDDFKGVYSIGPDGSMYLPFTRSLYVDGLTIDQLRIFLQDELKSYVKNPVVYVSPVKYRPVRVLVSGEVDRPGYYVLDSSLSGGSRLSSQTSIDEGFINNVVKKDKEWPTLFEALQIANGITVNSDLSKVTVLRKLPLGSSTTHKKATIDFLSLLTKGNESVNIDLFDGDSIIVSTSPTPVREQLLLATKSNLSPDFMKVFVDGRVNKPGEVTLRQGSALNQAIAAAGGVELLRGSIRFLRLESSGRVIDKTFSYSPSSAIGTDKNPILMAGDIVRVNDSLFSSGVKLFNELTGPAVGIYSVYSLFKP